MADLDDKRTDEEQEIARLLKAAGRREQLPADTRERWEAHFRAELAPVIARKRYRFSQPLYAVAASLAVIAVTLLLYVAGSSDTPAMAINAVAGEGLILDGTSERAAQPGQTLVPGTTLVTGSESQLALEWAGYDVRLNAGSRAQLFADRIALLEGEIYVSDEGRRVTRRQITISTPFATIRDIGTQFKVCLDEDRVVSTVRQGSIVMIADGEEFTASAEPGEARQLTVGTDLTVEEATVSASWDWIYKVSPEFDTAGRSAYEFLRWSVAESGRELMFTSEDVEIAARMAILSPADISSFDPDAAVDTVLKTTSNLIAEREGNVLRIRRRGKK